MGARISQEYKGKNLMLVTVLKGAVVFLADLMRADVYKRQVLEREGSAKAHGKASARQRREGAVHLCKLGDACGSGVRRKHRVV